MGVACSPRAVVAVALAAAAVAAVWTSSGDSVLETRPEDWELPAEVAPSTSRSNTPPRKRPLVAAVGLSRTGTSSLTAALSQLGYQTYHTQETMLTDNEFWYYYLSGQITRPDVRRLLDGKDAVLDCWYAILVDEIVAAYPDVKLLLTTRETDAWLQSYKKYVASSSLYHWPQHAHRLFLSAASRALRLGPALRALGWIPPSSGYDLEKVPQLMAIWRLSDQIFFGSTQPGSHPLWRQAPAKHLAYIRALVPSGQLLELNPTAGYQNSRSSNASTPWGSIVDFLELDPTDPTIAAAVARPYPHKFRASDVKSGGGSNRSSSETTAHERYTAAAVLLLSLSVALLLKALPGGAAPRQPRACRSKEKAQ